jgi:hypothetical protein
MARFPLVAKPASTVKISKLATGPTIRRGKGNGSAATPWEFARAVEGKFGPLGWDLAANAANSKVQVPRYFGPDSANGTDSLVQDWHRLNTIYEYGLLWLNPPYANITVWARKCAEECQLGARILLLVPASVGANWFWQWVVPFADIYSVGRMVFGDCYDSDGKPVTTPYPKDLILAHYDWSPDRCLRTGATNTASASSIYRWRWQDGQ